MLGINLMRLGQNEEAYKQLETCLQQRLQEQRHRNSLKLMDSYKNFVTFKTDRTILKLHKKEADLLRPYFESEIERAIATYEKKYKIKLRSRCRWRSIPTTRTSPCARSACPAWARSA